MSDCRFFLPFAYGLYSCPKAQGRPGTSRSRVGPVRGRAVFVGPPHEDAAAWSRSRAIFAQSLGMSHKWGCSAITRLSGFAGGPRRPWRCPSRRRAAQIATQRNTKKGGPERTPRSHRPPDIGARSVDDVANKVITNRLRRCFDVVGHPGKNVDKYVNKLLPNCR